MTLAFVDRRAQPLRDPWQDVSDADLQAVYGWSQTAIDIAHRHGYVRRAGVPTVIWEGERLGPGRPVDGAPTGGESGVDAAIRRMARFWAWGMWTRGDFGDAVPEARDAAEAVYARIVEDLRLQVWAPNSPQWYNAGLWHSYGITHDLEMWGIDGKSDRNEALFPLHACYIQPVEDNLAGPGGIVDLIAREARVFKFGGGSGTDFSGVRERGAPLSGGGTSSGLVSFLWALDAPAGAIKSGGTTRRAAKMVVCDICHPDILEIIDAKARAEDVALAVAVGAEVLLRQGRWSGPPMSLRWNAGQTPDGPQAAYRHAPLQNANLSIKASGAWLWRQWDTDGEIPLRARGDGRVVGTIRARDLVARWARAIKHSGDPGVQWTDLIEAGNTCPVDGHINASNPCSEYLWHDDTACNLASINLMKLETRDDIESCAALVARVLDVTIDLAGYHSRSMALRSARFRTIGVGPANLGARLMVEGLRYGEDGAIRAGNLVQAIAVGAARMSAVLADLHGPFPAFEVGPNARVTRQVFEAQVGPRLDGCHWRNAQLTVAAPTGTIGLVMDCDSTGIEPVFGVGGYTKTMADGSTRTFYPRCVDAARELGRGGAVVDAHDLTVEDHLAIVAAVQRRLSGGASKTLNLPATATEDDIVRALRRSWELGVKCISIYPAGAKHSEVLGGGDPDAKVCDIVNRASRPSRRNPYGSHGARRWSIRLGGVPCHLTLAHDDDGPIALRLECEAAGSEGAVQLDAIGRLASRLLQAGVPLAEVADTLARCAGPSGGSAVPAAAGIRWAMGPIQWAGRVLATLGDGEPDTVEPVSAGSVGGDVCGACGGSLVSTGTCRTCRACGTSTGGCG